mmetsp:Transcript_24333/g.96494  ORF Transcript_24333/g.96494 Transcript_24333/m.96494 type:complete len:106 (+) Transcript_24333:195-512(+)
MAALIAGLLGGGGLIGGGLYYGLKNVGADIHHAFKPFETSNKTIDKTFFSDDSKLVWAICAVCLVWIVLQVPFERIGRALSKLLEWRNRRLGVHDIVLPPGPAGG